MVRKLILEKIAERGLDMKNASLRMGQNHSYLYQFLKLNRPRQLGEEQRAALAAVLGVPEEALRGPSAKLPTREYSKPNDAVTNRHGGIPVTMSGTVQTPIDNAALLSSIYGSERDLPVFATAQGGRGGALIMSNEAVDWVTRPAPLLKVRDGYGMIVTGDSMSPKFENGSTALVNPHLPPRNGSACVFRNHQDDGTVLAIIKTLIRFNDDTWFVSQFSPKKEFQLKRSEWQVCHVTVGSYFS